MALTPEPSDLALAGRLVLGAGSRALSWWRAEADLEVGTKRNPTDVVTAADLAAEQHVVDLLTAERPEDGLLGEEGAVQASASGRTWVIDPVDGTYNFVRGDARWCSAVALVQDGVALVGAVSQPATGETVVGGPTVGVRRDGLVVAPLTARDLSQCSLLTYLHPPAHDTEAGAAWRRLVAGVATLRMTGSGSLDAVDVALGRADLLVQHSVPDWDRLPGEALVHGVGGETRVVRAAGVDWYVAGRPGAVARACDLLADR